MPREVKLLEEILMFMDVFAVESAASLHFFDTSRLSEPYP